MSEEEWREFDIANVLPSHFVGAVTEAGETIYFRPDVLNDLLASAEQEAAIAELQGAPSITMRMMVPAGADVTIFSRDGKLALTCGGPGQCMQVLAGALLRLWGLNFMRAKDGGDGVCCLVSRELTRVCIRRHRFAQASIRRRR